MNFASDPLVTRRNAVHLLWIRERLAAISSVGHRPPGIDRQILALAVPALGALVAEPLFVLVDSAVVGHLGTAPLAGLALASTVLMTVIGLCVFLAYATTAAVARRLGVRRPRGCAPGRRRRDVARARPRHRAGRRHLAQRAVADRGPRGFRRGRPAGRDLPALVGAGPPRHAPGPRRPRAPCAGCWTPARRWSSPRPVPSSTPCSTSCSSTASGMGIAGSGLGTAAHAAGDGRGAHRRRRPRCARLGRAAAPGRRRHLANARAGTPLFVRTLSLRLAILLTVWVATGLGRGRARRAPGGQRRLGARRVRARRPRHRRAGPDRPRPGRRRRPPRPRGPAAHAPVGRRGRRRARPRSSAGCRGSTSRSSRRPTTSEQPPSPPSSSPP